MFNTKSLNMRLSYLDWPFVAMSYRCKKNEYTMKRIYTVYGNINVNGIMCVLPVHLNKLPNGTLHLILHLQSCHLYKRYGT